VLEAFNGGKGRSGIRLVHYSVQGNHLHLIVEAPDRALSRGMQGLAIRLARKLNGVMGRKGKVFTDRYHARILRSPVDVRRTILYVLNNHRKHRREWGQPDLPRWWLDPCSSALAFVGWRPVGTVEERRCHGNAVTWRAPPGVQPCLPPRSWLLATGWRRGVPAWRHGDAASSLDRAEVPRAPR
jgi:hypothetical protein